MQEKYTGSQKGLCSNLYLNLWVKIICLVILYGNLIFFAINIHVQQASAIDEQPSILFKTALNGYQPDVPPGPYLTTGSVMSWSYTITNTGNVPFDNVTLDIDLQGQQTDSDDITGLVLSGDENENALLDVGEAWIFTVNLTIGDGPYIATSSISAAPIDQLGKPILGSDDLALPPLTSSENLYYVGAQPDIELSLHPNGLAFLVGETIGWTYTVVNNGTIPLTNILLRDDTYGPIHTQLDRNENGDENGNGLLDIGEQWVYKINDLVPPGQQTRIAQVSAQPADASGMPLVGLDKIAFNPVISTATSDYLGVRPGLTLNYHAGEIDGDEAYMATTNEDILYTFLVENSGDVPLTNLQIQDDNGTIDIVSDGE